VRECGSLTDLNGLNGITSVGELSVRENESLESLDGLESLTMIQSTEQYSLMIDDNPILPDCEVCLFLEQIESLPEVDVINFDYNLVDECTPVPDNCP
jgi:hypothetical protein